MTGFLIYETKIRSLFASYNGGVFLFLFDFFFFFALCFGLVYNYDDDDDDHDNDFCYFLYFGCCLFLSLPAASVPVTMLLLFQTGIIKLKKKFKSKLATCLFISLQADFLILSPIR